MGFRFGAVIALVVLLTAGAGVMASPKPGPTPLSPSVWIDFGGRNCDSPLNVPCVPTIAIALTIVDSGGRIVLLHNATYDESANVDTCSCTIVGENRTSSIVEGGSRNHAFSIASGGVTLKNFTIQNAQEAVQVAAPAVTLDALVIKSSPTGVKTYGATSRLTIVNTEIHNADVAAVNATQSDGLTIGNVTIFAGGIGLSVANSGGLVIKDSYVLGPRGAGILLTRQSGPRIGNANVTAGADRGIRVEGGDGVAIVGNALRNNGMTGLAINGTVNVLVQGNVITGNGRLGIPPRPGPGPSPSQGGGGGARFLQTDPVLILNNTISGNQFFGLAITGNASKDYTLLGNTVANNTGPGLVVADGATRIDVSGTFRDNQGDGVSLDRVTNVSLHDSTSIGNWGRGVSGSFATNVTVANNTLQGNLLGAVRFLQTDPSAVRGNLISGNLGPGIALLNTTDFQVADNTIDDNADSGLQIQDAVRTTVTSNRVHGHVHSLSQVAGDVTASRNRFANASGESVSLTGGARFTGTNDTFVGSAYPFLLFNASRALVLNESFSAANFRVLDPLSNLTVLWFLHVSVIDAGGSPAPAATVRVFDATPAEVFNGTADLGGNRSWIILSWFDMTGSNTFLHSPHDARAYMTGPDEGSVPVTMDASKSVTIRLVQDSVPPTVTNLTAAPDPQEQGQAVDVSADVTDAHLASVFLNVTYPDSSFANASMMPAGGNRFHLSGPYGLVGTYAYSVVARDTFGNVATASGTFGIFPPNLAPSIANATAVPDPSEAGGTVNISATIQDTDGVASATVAVTFPDSSVITAALTRAGSVWYFQTPYSALGSYSFTINATDANTTFPSTATATGSFSVQDTRSPVANAGPDQTVPQNTLVQFDGTGSTDVVGIVNYTWTFTDGAPRTLYGATPSYRFANVGSFAASLTARDASGNLGTDTMTVTVLDVTPPTISGLSATPVTVEAPGFTNVTFTASDNVGILGAWVEARFGNASKGNQSVFVAPSTFNPSMWYLNLLGPYSFVVSVEDTSGNWIVRPVVALAEDTIAPAFLSFGAIPAAQQVFSPVLLWARVTDPYLDASSLAANVSRPGGAPRTNLTMTYNPVNLRYEASVSPDVLGTYTFIVWAFDTARNFALQSGTFVSRDTVAPTIISWAVAPQPQDVGGVVDVSAGVSEDFALASVTIEFLDPYLASSGPFQMLLGADTRWHDARAYPIKGIWSFTIRARDTSGNLAVPLSGSISIVDREPPSITNIAVTPPGWEAGGTIAVNATVTDNVGVSLVALEVTDPQGNPAGNHTMACVLSRCGFARPYPSAGNYTLRIWATDTSGKVADASVILQMVPGKAPEAHAGPDVAIDAGQSVAFNGSASTDDYGIVSFTWTFTYDGNPVTLTGAAPAAFRFNVPGSYTVTFTVEDVAGHRASDTLLVTVRAPGGGAALDPLLLVPLALIILLVLAFVVRWMRRRTTGRRGSPEEPGEESGEAPSEETTEPLDRETPESEVEAVPEQHEEEEL